MSHELNNSVLIPRDDFLELQLAAFNNGPTPPGERIATTVQTAVVFTMIAGTIAGGSWAFYKARDWFEQKSFARQKESDYKFKTSTQM